MTQRCPGQDKRNLKIESCACPECGYEIEVFSDELKARCPRCQRIVAREALPNCIDWCRYAKECAGQEALNARREGKSAALKERLLKDMEGYFAQDLRRINHAKRVMGFAEELLRKEGGDWHIVIPASILHDVGIKAAEKKYGSCAGHYQEQEGPAIAAQILRKEGFREQEITEICEIIAHHHSPGKVDTLNFMLLYEADWLVNLKDEADLQDKTRLAGIIEKVFSSAAGKQKAKELYLQGGGGQ
jgi:HD superfamily phosphohydrolase YqeK